MELKSEGEEGATIRMKLRIWCADDEEMETRLIETFPPVETVPDHLKGSSDRQSHFRLTLRLLFVSFFLFFSPACHLGKGKRRRETGEGVAVVLLVACQYRDLFNLLGRRQDAARPCFYFFFIRLIRSQLKDSKKNNQ